MIEEIKASDLNPDEYISKQVESIGSTVGEGASTHSQEGSIHRPSP
jgi:hypothetical protein